MKDAATLTPVRKEPLTARQSEVYEAILAHVAEHGVPPTIREIGEAFGIVSPNGVMSHLKPMAAKGWLTGVESDKARCVLPVELRDRIRAAAATLHRRHLRDRPGR